MSATAARRASRAARHAGRALRRGKVPAVFAALAATVLAVGGAGLALEANHDAGPGRPGHMMMEQGDTWGSPDEHRDRPHPPWEH